MGHPTTSTQAQQGPPPQPEVAVSPPVTTQSAPPVTTQTAPPSIAPPAVATQIIVEIETWRNPGAGRVVLRKMDHRGELNKEEMIRPGQTFTITPVEREANQNMAHSPELDMFRNGTLAPVRLIEGSDIAREAAVNPNLLSEGDMRSMVGVRGKGPARAEIAEAFAERLDSISNSTTLRRLLTMAQEEDAPYSRVLAIQERLAAVEGPGYEPAGADDDPVASAPPGGDRTRSAAAGPGSRPVTTR